MSTGEGRERERFAAAVERGLGSMPPGDDELRQELELVALLRESRAALAPSADASARMRAKVMAAAATMMAPADGRTDSAHTAATTAPDAGAPTLVDNPIPVIAETSDETTEETQSNVVSIGRARGKHRFSSRKANTSPGLNPHRRGLLGISAAAALMVLAVTGGGAMFSQNALPGDSLYGVKQASESAMVGLTPGQGNKAQRQLDYAATRIGEVQKLNSSADSPNKAADISQALKGFNEQTESGSRMWLAGSGTSNSAELGALANWSQSQQQKLSQMRSTMPASAQPDADHSMRLLEDVRTRAQQLRNRQGCDKVTSGTDQLGPVPAKGACTSKESLGGSTVKLPSSDSSDKSSSSSEPSSDSDSLDSSSSEKSSKSEKSKDDSDDTPKLPGIGNLTGKDGVSLPEKQQTKGGDVLPKEKPALNLPIPLLPILFQPLSSGLSGKTDG
ncbi:DUF5667 domain-containing protein [Pseudonocardia spinosispora]|uniref:DUF5667 domain-containing protein n=1 Tax=Pseudonocardia spinosispora TaxID=103441 RepID=UPI00041BAB0F|nr:DUF5667 domain-containing protein [Pseudonocardia spinosispora]